MMIIMILTVTGVTVSPIDVENKKKKMEKKYYRVKAHAMADTSKTIHLIGYFG